MIYKIGAKVKFKIGNDFKCGIILGRNTIDHPDFPYLVRSGAHFDYWINEDSIVLDYPKLKYIVGDRVIFKLRNDCLKRIGTIVHVEDCSQYPYDIRDDQDVGTYVATDDDIIGYAEEKIDCASFLKVLAASKYLPEAIKPKLNSLPYESNNPLLYSKKDVEVLENWYSRYIHTFAYLPKIKKVIFNDPATIVFWEDGTKTVVKAQTSVTGQAFADGQHLIDLTKTDLFDPEKGLAMAITKKALGNNGNYYEEFKKWLPKED